MQTRSALRHMSGGELSYEWGDGPLAKVANQLLEAFHTRETERMDAAEVAAATVGTGAMLTVLQRRFAEAEARSLIDVAAPMIMRFDAYQCLLDASREQPSDRGLKLAAAHAKQLWTREPDGVLAVGDVARLRAHWTTQFPRSRVASVIDGAFAKVGFNTLPVGRLAQLAAHIRGRDLSELEASYETVVRAHGLDGDAPHQIRARAYLRGLVHLASEPEPSGTVEAGGEAAGNRALWRMAAYDDPILRAVGQLEPVSEPDMGQEPPIDATPLGPHESEVPHQEEEGTIVQVDSPITGEPLALELELAAPEQDIPLEDVDSLERFGQLEDFADPMAPGESPMVEEGEGVVETTIEDPSAPGEMLEVTIAPMGTEDAESDVSSVPLDVPLEGGSHMARVGVAPPGKEQMVRELKKSPSAKNPWAVAWAQYNKEKREGSVMMEHQAVAPEGWEHAVKEMKKEKSIDNPWALAWWMKGKGMKPHPEHEAGRYAVYAVRGGILADEPLERIRAESMPRALRHVAESLGELGATGVVKARPETFAEKALIVLDAAAGNHLLVVAEGPEKGSEFRPHVNEQQPAQVSVPTDGSDALASNGGFDQPRATRPVDVSPGAAAVSRHAMTKEEVHKFCAQLGLTPASIEATLLAADPVVLREGARVAWKLEVDDDGQVALSNAAGVVKTSSITAMDEAIDDFLARCAAEYSLGGEVAGDRGVAPAEARFEIHALFQVGCAQCGGVDEFMMPKEASATTCGSCGYETSAQAVAVQLAARRGAAQGYLIVTEIPGEPANFELNARRLMTAIQRVVPTATGTLRPEGQLEVTVRAVQDQQLARIRNVLESAFGVKPQTKAAQGGPTQQDMGATPPTQIGVGVNTQPQPAPTYKPPVQVPTPPIGGPSMAPQTGPTPPAPTGTPAQQKFMDENASIEPVQARRQAPVWDLTYQTEQGPMTLQVEAADANTARRIFAAYDPDTRILSVRQGQATPPAPAPEPAGDPAAAPPAAPAPAGPEALGGMPAPSGGLGVGQGASMTPEVQEAIRAAMLTLRNTGIDPASAVDKFQSQFKMLLQKYGDEYSHGRQQLGAEIIKAVQDAWSKPALIDLTASLADATVEALLKAAIGKMPAPGKIAPEQNQDKVRLPGTNKLLGPDSASQEPKVMSPGKIKTQHGKPQGGGSPTDMGGGEESHDPGTFGAGKPPADGQYGLVGKGTDTPPKDLGRDSQTGNNATTTAWDGVSSGAAGHIRSKPGGSGAPDARRKATAGLSRMAAASHETDDALFWLGEAVRRAKATGEFPEDELWQARDAGIERLAAKMSGPAQAIVKEALAAL